MSFRAVAGIAIEAALAAFLLASWIVARPGHDVYDDPSAILLAALVVCLISGWHLLGGWGCAVGCFVQLLRFGALVVLFVLSFSAYNPHMDNGCFGSGRPDDDSPGSIGSCIEDAQRDFRATYFALAGATAAVALSMAVYVVRDRTWEVGSEFR